MSQGCGRNASLTTLLVQEKLLCNADANAEQKVLDILTMKQSVEAWKEDQREEQMMKFDKI